MPTRTTARPLRENDFSDVGKVGRRTGVTLPRGRIDENGIEEITGIFSSPRKPSPLKQSMLIIESVEKSTSATPPPALSARKSLPPRSASPRKSGISGTARRSKAIDVFRERDSREDHNDVQQSSPQTRPQTLAASSGRRSGASNTPLRDSLLSRPQSTRIANQTRSQAGSSPREDEASHTPRTRSTRGKGAANSQVVVEIPKFDPFVAEATQEEDDYALPTIDDDEDQVSIADSQQEDLPHSDNIPLQYDDEDVDGTFEPETRVQPRSKEPTKANSRKKRKSDAIEQDVEIETVSSPAAKRAKRISDEGAKRKSLERVSSVDSAESVEVVEDPPPEASKPKSTGRGRPPLKKKDTNTKMSARQQKELDDVVEKIRSRPGQKKSLYILRRETPADDGVTHTRSGRISIKPLAFWRNEQCVYGGSPGGVSLADGARFPLNSIKEIIRRDEIETRPTKKTKRSTTKGKGKGKGKAVAQSQSPNSQSESEFESEVEGEDIDDPDATSWETEIGSIRGPVSVWDAGLQTPIDEQEEMDIAYASAAIETRDVKGSSFKYAKLLSTKFMGSGIVELPPGGIKRPKNSRKMHMSFFVATGRVMVQVGPINGPESEFSIGTGGFWQVPRGNQYSIRNDHHKNTARLFFSQACENTLLDVDD